MPDQGDEVDGPVLGVEERRRHDGDGDEVAGTGLVDGTAQGQEAAAGQEDDQGVHAGLGGVVHREGRAGQQHDHRPGHGPAAEAAPAEPADGKGRHGEEPGEGAHGAVGLSEDDHPEVQQVVVERRRPVVLQCIGDVMQREPGDVDGEGLVEPEPRAGPEPEEQSGGDRQPHCDPDGDAQTTGESGNLLRHGAHGRTRGLRSRIIRRRGRPARGKGIDTAKGGKGRRDPLHHQAVGAAHHHHHLRVDRDLLPGPPPPGQPHRHHPGSQRHGAERGHAQPSAGPRQAAVAAVLHLDRPRVPGQPGPVLHDAPVDVDHHQRSRSPSTSS